MVYGRSPETMLRRGPLQGALAFPNSPQHISKKLCLLGSAWSPSDFVISTAFSRGAFQRGVSELPPSSFGANPRDQPGDMARPSRSEPQRLLEARRGGVEQGPFLCPTVCCRVAYFFSKSGPACLDVCLRRVGSRFVDGDSTRDVPIGILLSDFAQQGGDPSPKMGVYLSRCLGFTLASGNSSDDIKAVTEDTHRG